MFCTSCGTKFKIEDNFCGNCGTKRSFPYSSNITTAESLEEHSSLAVEEEDSWMERLWVWADKNDISELCIPRNPSELTQLTWLYLVGDKLNELPKEIGQLTHLEWLDLKGNELNELPKEIGQLTQLIWLDLEGNELNELPKEIGQLTQLTLLNLKGNELNELPKEIVSLKKLDTLYIDNFPLSEGQLEWISELKRNGCEVDGGIEESLLSTYTTKNTEDIDLDRIKIKIEKVIEWIKEYDIDLPIVVDELMEIDSIDIEDNKLISHIPEEVKYLKNLKDIYITKTSIQNIPGFFNEIKNLETIVLDDSNLFSLNKNELKLDGLENVQTLSLCNNWLKDFPEEIKKLKNLKVLHLNYNCFTESIQNKIRSWLPNCKIHLDSQFPNRWASNLMNWEWAYNQHLSRSICEITYREEADYFKYCSEETLYEYFTLDHYSVEIFEKIENLDFSRTFDNYNSHQEYNDFKFHIPNQFEVFKNLKKINLDDSFSHYNLSTLQNLTKLEDLEIVSHGESEYSSSSNLRSEVDKLKFIKKLKITVVCSNIINEQLFAPQTARELEIEFKLEDGYGKALIPDKINQLQNLKKLIIRAGGMPFQLAELHEEDESSPIMECQSNEFLKFPQSMNLLELQDLTLYAPLDMESLHSLSGLKNLKRLTMNWCSIDIVPKFIMNLNKLEYLSLSRNCFFELPEFITECESLRELYIDPYIFENKENEGVLQKLRNNDVQIRLTPSDFM
jgi:Leucine-rich repeat (LRR) protein